MGLRRKENPRSVYVVLSVGDTVYVVGGRGIDGGNEIETVETIDVSTGAVGLGTALPTGLAHHGCATSSGQLIVAGGYVDGDPSSAVWVFDPSFGWSAGPALPAPRARLACAARGMRMVCVGGVNDAGDTIASVYEWNRNGDTDWQTKATMLHPRRDAALVYSRTFYVLGGEFDGSPTSTIDSFTPDGNRWYAVGTLTHAAAGAAFTSVGSECILVGGLESGGVRARALKFSAR
ncbi:MAG: hypothetical protein AAF654_08045 [Myxococcota bacterium]